MGNVQKHTIYIYLFNMLLFQNHYKAENKLFFSALKNLLSHLTKNKRMSSFIFYLWGRFLRVKKKFFFSIFKYRGVF